MPDINMQVFEEAKRNQLVTEIDIQTQVALDDYQVQLSDIANPTQSQDNVVIDRFGEFLPHWNESLDFDTWVKISTELAGKKLLMIHGNDGLSSASNGIDVFQRFYDFEDNTLQGFSASGGTVISSTHAIGSYSVKIDDTGGAEAILSRSDFDYQEGILEWDTYRTPSASVWLATQIYDGATGIFLHAISTAEAIKTHNGAAWVDYSNGAASATGNTWEKHSLKFKESTSYLQATVDEVNLGTGTRQNTGTIDTLKYRSATGPGTGLSGYIDNIRLRKYTGVEPTSQISTPKNISTALKSLGRAG